ncbi:MAG: DEAD/DEAH box helicase [Eubacteriales bacterium]|nr:DEAD/DEAH box helicase [Eubacteriales bacterium]MDD4512845.1 DEAD/DEAH box helicase [Eubacteriales bacterium]
MTDEERNLLPVYLRKEEYAEDDKPRRYFGTLSFNRKRKCFTVRGESHMVEMAKRLFPSSAGARRGEARFTAHRRVVQDLCWFMSRYPLEIKKADRKRFDELLLGAQEYYVSRERLRCRPERAVPPQGSFIGSLRPFQEEGLAWLLSSERCLLADEMGLGKTVEALAMLAAQRTLPALIIAPPHLILNWLSEIKRFLRIDGREPQVHIIKGLKPYPLPKADIYLSHYLILRGWKEELPEMEFPAVIFDEVQELRRAGTEKYSAASLISESAGKVVGLSGTPIYNVGGEIWNVINILDFHFLGDWESFTREWCYGYGNRIVVHPDTLGEFLRSEGMMLRRVKADVLSQLPPKRRLVQEIDVNDKLFQALMQGVYEKLSVYRTSELTASERALLEDQISQQERQATGIAKADFVSAFVKNLIENGEKVLLFAHHHAVMDLYKQELAEQKPVFITGRETPAQKEQAVLSFMSGATDLCCISLRAASGLNLQRASAVVFGELDWSPAVHSQAEDRAHRIGQQDSLLCYYLVSPRGSDQDMQEALGLKVSQFVELMGDAIPSMEEQERAAGAARRHVMRLLEKNAG